MADGKLRTVIEIDHRAFDQGFVHINKKMDEGEKKAKQFGKSLDKSTQGLGASISNLAAKYVTLGAAIAMVSKVVKDAVSINAQFERKNSELASVLGTTKEGVKNLSIEAEKLGRVTEFTATEVTELQLALARLGFTNSQIIDMQGTVLKFAAAVNADLGRAANFAGAALRGFGLEAKDSTHLLDVMAAATSKSALDFSKLETSISIVAPIAHTFGLTVEDTVTLLGSLANAGFDASSAATATRNILLNLADANGKLAKGLGHTAKNFPEIIAALKECRDKGMDLNATLEMTDKRSVAAFNSLITGAASADELRTALGNVDGTLEQMYDTMTDNLIGATRELKSAWEGLLLKFQESTGPMADVCRWLAKMLNLATDWIDANNTGGMSPKQKKEQNELYDRFKKTEELSGTDAMRQQFLEWEKSANAAYDRAIDAYNEAKKHVLEFGGQKRLREAEKAMYEAGAYVMNLSDIKGRIMGTGGSAAPAPTTTATPTTTTTTMTEEEKKEAKRYGEAFKKAIRDMWKSVSDTEIAAMKEGSAKKLAQIENERRQSLDAIDHEYEELEKAARKSGNKISQATMDQFDKRRADTETIAANKRKEVYDEMLLNQFAYLEEYGSYKEKELAIEQRYNKLIEQEQDEWKKKSLEQEKIAALGELHERQLTYLEQYGTYKEKELAITERYNQQIARSNDEVEKATLRKERDKTLRELEQNYDYQYSLIFADAQSLSKNLLKQAIEATQKAIEKARESGDIQALTELYARLREQMTVQGDYTRGWGWSGIAQGFSMRNSASEKRSLADTLEGQLASREDTLQWMKNAGIDDEKIEAARKKIEELRVEIQRLRDEAANDDAKALDFLEKGFSEVGKVMSELGSSMSSFRDNLGGVCDTIADIGDVMSEWGKQADTIQSAFSGTMTTASAISTAISATIQLATMIGQSIVNNKKAQEEWNRTIDAAAMKYRLLQIEALDYKQQNVFGVENPYKKAIDGAKQYHESVVALNESVNKLANGQVQTGTKKVVDWANVGKGAAIGTAAGAAVGSIIPGIGTAIGAAVGAAIGLVTGAIAGALSTKIVPVFENLQSHYGQLFDPQTYELNPQLVADYDKLDEDTKQIVDNWQAIVDKAKEAEAQMRETFSNLAGDVGNQLADSLVSAFRNGDVYAAIDDFHAKMTSTIEDIMEQLVFSSTMGAMFDELEDRMMKSFGLGGDQDIVDDLIWMEQEYQKRLEQYNEAMGQVQQSLRGLGYEAWESDQRTAQTKAALGASQDSVDESNARLTTIQGHTFELAENVRSIRQQHDLLIANTAALLEHVQGIHSDTAEMRATLDEVRSMAAVVKSNVGTIVDRGVKAL